jgi:osmotically-inducible protein OsmY
MKKIFTLLVVLIILPGCVAGAFVAGTATGAAILADRRDLQTMADDKKIALDIQQKLTENKRIVELAHIDVTSFNRVVLLAGQAPTAELRSSIEQIAQTTPKIRRLYNYISIAKPTSDKSRHNDALITANIRTRLLAATDLHSSQIKVVTENGVVYLMGFTTRNQANIAANIARESKGVKQVIRLIEYVKG